MLSMRMIAGTRLRQDHSQMDNTPGDLTMVSVEQSVSIRPIGPESACTPDCRFPKSAVSLTSLWWIGHKVRPHGRSVGTSQETVWCSAALDRVSSCLIIR